MVSILALIAILAAALFYAGTQRSSYKLRLYMVVCMVLTTITGAVLLPPIFGHVSNAGNIFYVGAVASHGVIFMRDGREEAARAIRGAFAALLLILAVVVVMDHMAVDGADIPAHTQALLNDIKHFAPASLGAFALSQLVLWSLMDRWWRKSIWIRYGLAVVLAQAVDSAIFFPVAFGADIVPLAGLALTGFAIKAVLGLLSVPLVAAIVDRDHFGAP